MALTRSVRLGYAGAVALLSIIFIAPTCSAGDLDSAYQFWHVVNNQLGRDATIQSADTLKSPVGALQAAVNSCIRKVVASIGLVGHEKIVLVEGSPYYTLQASFIEEGIASRPFTVMAREGSNTLYGLVQAKSPSELANLLPALSFPTLWWLSDDQFWVNIIKDGDTLFIDGPIAGIVMQSGRDTTNVLDQDRSAVCDCATALIGKSISNPAADFYWDRFVSHVISRGGTTPQAGP